MSFPSRLAHRAAAPQVCGRRWSPRRQDHGRVQCVARCACLLPCVPWYQIGYYILRITLR